MLQNSNIGINSDKLQGAVKNDKIISLQPASYFKNMLGAKHNDLVVIPPQLFLKKCSSMSHLDGVF